MWPQSPSKSKTQCLVQGSLHLPKNWKKAFIYHSLWRPSFLLNNVALMTRSVTWNIPCQGLMCIECCCTVSAMKGNMGRTIQRLFNRTCFSAKGRSPVNWWLNQWNWTLGHSLIGCPNILFPREFVSSYRFFMKQIRAGLYFVWVILYYTISSLWLWIYSPMILVGMTIAF